jgi:hypothetical protein
MHSRLPAQQKQCHKVLYFHEWKKTYTGNGSYKNNAIKFLTFRTGKEHNGYSKNNAINFLTFMTGKEHIMDLPRTMNINFLTLTTGKEHIIDLCEYGFGSSFM